MSWGGKCTWDKKYWHILDMELEMPERKCVAVDKKVFSGNLAKRFLLLSTLLLGIQVFANRCGVEAKEVEQDHNSFGNTMLMSIAQGTEEVIYRQFMPEIAYAEESVHGVWWLLRSQVDCLFPLYGYMADKGAAEDNEATADYRTLLMAEAEEGYGEGMGPSESIPGQEDENTHSWVGEQTTGDSSMNVGENPAGKEQGTGESKVGLWIENSAGGDTDDNSMEETLKELLRAENEAALQMQISSFVPHGVQNNIGLDSLRDYDTLIRQFYTIDPNTSAGSDKLNVDKLLKADMTIPKGSPGPQILIYHTHSQEAFSDSVAGDESTTIMGVGDRLTEILTLDYGYEVLHHRGQYDVKSRDNAYANALPEIEQLLEDNPTIQVVIDLHRDEMPEGTRLAMDLDGRPTARFMFFNGMSRTRKTGNIAYLYNENLDSNLAFSFQMQLKAMEYYPGLTRRIYLKGYRYNMHLCPKYLLIELGAQNNTVEEAMNACDPLAHILDMVLSGEE